MVEFSSEDNFSDVEGIRILCSEGGSGLVAEKSWDS